MQRFLLLCLLHISIFYGDLAAAPLSHQVFPDGCKWTSVNDTAVIAEGNWTQDRFRFADADHKYTTDDKASLNWSFSAASVAVRLAGQNTSSYPGTGLPAHGKLSVYLDGRLVKVIYPAQQGREFIVANNLEGESHELTLVHSIEAGAAGVRVEGFLTSDSPLGLFSLSVTAELQEYMNDVRFVISNNGSPIRSTIGRNWLTGNASMILPTGASFDVRIEAMGWSSESIKTPKIEPDELNTSSPIYLRRDPKTVSYRFRYPSLNNQAIRKSGESLTARFLGFDTKIDKVRLRRRNGNAVFTRVLPFREDKEAAFYYDRQIEISLPDDTPPGVYDLEVDIIGGRRTSTCRSPSSVVIVKRYPGNPRFVTFGHLDTSGQFQAEYVRRIARMANIIGADMVLASNSVNAAYLSGALSNLQMPYLINFGNHQVFGHHRWYGPDLGGVVFGPDLFVLNYGLPWHEPIKPVVALLEQHRSKRLKVINAFEHNAPNFLLNDYKIAMIHDAHGPGDKLMKMGSTPTQRVGKGNSVSFRIVEFNEGQVSSATYNHHPTAPIPFERDQQCPLRVERETPFKAIVINEYNQSFPRARITLLVPVNEYSVNNGSIQSISISDDGKLAEVIIAIDLSANSRISMELTPK